MEDEIKKILSYMQQYVEEPNGPDYNGEYPQPWEITIEEVQYILDYITNLQEDLKYQEEMEEEYNKKHTKLMQDYSNLQEENEKLKKIKYEARKMIFNNYGLLDKYEIDLLDDILKGEL